MLTIIRDSNATNGTRAYKVVLDGVVLGKIKNNQTLEFDLAPGHHELVLKIDWCRSNIVEFDTEDGNARYACGAYVSGLAASIVMRNEYLYLIPAELLDK